MAEKQNDMLSLKIFNPDATLSQLNLAGISADNTQLKSEQDYARLESVQSQPQFLDQSGTFDKAKFHQFYQDAQRDYNILAATANNQTVYSKYNIFAPVNQRNWNPTFEIKRFNNPFEQTMGLAGIGELGEQKKSIEEIAQTQKVWDSKTNTWKDSPNDSFFGNFSDTRFLAQYDQDVDEKDPITGEIVHHYAGEFKLNDEGKPYYENANGRSINGKTVLHLSDVFTTDGSAINSIDFLDSDDMHKSALGTLAKNTALIGSMFLPGVGPYVAGLVVLQNSMQLGSVLGKMLTSVDNPTFNKIEGFAHFTNLHESKSQYSKDPDHMWSLENTINLIGDVAGQLQTQRFLFKYAPSLFKGKYGYTKEGDELLKSEKFAELSKYNSKKLGDVSDRLSSQYMQAKAELDMANSVKAAAEVEKYMKEYYNIGGVISKAYMTGITVQDMFQEAKDSGANDISAIGLTLGYAAAEYALLSTGLGEWILPELRLAKAENKQIFKKLLDPARKNFKDGIETLNKGVEKAVTREERHNIFKKAVDFGRKIANADYSILKKSAGSIAAGALGEGTEEVSEELLADAFRKIHDVVPWLRGNDGKEMFSSDRIFDRYLQNFVGGLIGGGIAGLGFDGNSSAYKQYKDLENMTSEQAMQRMIYKLRNEKNAGKELRDTVRKMDWGSKNLAAFKFTQDKNKNTFFDEAANYEESQDFAIKQAAYKQIDLVESVLQAIENESGASVSDKSILDANTLKDLRYAMFQNSTAAGQLIENFNTEVMNMVKAQSNISSMNSIEGRENDNVPDQQGKQNSQSIHDQNLKDEQTKFETAKQNAIDILTGKRATKFMTRAILELNPSIAQSFMIATFDQFVKQNLNKTVSELTDDERTIQYNKYIEYCKTAKKDSLEFAEQNYLGMVKLVQNSFVPKLEEAYKGFTEINTLDQTLTNLYNTLKDIRLGTLSPIPEFREDNDKYIETANATAPGSIQELVTGETKTTYRLNGLSQLAQALKAQGDEIAIKYLAQEEALDPNAEDFQDTALGIVIPFAVHGLQVITEEYKKQGWINPVTRKYIENLSDIIGMELSNLNDAFYAPNEFFGIDDLSVNLNEYISPFKKRLRLMVDGLNKEINDFDANNPIEEQQDPIIKAIDSLDTNVRNLKNALSELPNGPTLDLLDNFIVDLSGTVHIPLSQLLDNADALMRSKSMTQFTELDINVESGLKQALVATELMQAYLEGARTTNAGYTQTTNMLAGNVLGGTGAFLSTDKLNFNTTGINKMLNDIHKQVKEQAKKAPKLSKNQETEEEEWEDLPLIDGVVADSILQDLTLINRKIHFILDLLEINKGQKLNEQLRINTNTAYLRYKAISKLKDVVPDEWDKTALDIMDTRSSKIEELMSKQDKLTLNEDEQFELEKFIVELEDAVYDFFNCDENKDRDLKELLASKTGNSFDFYTESKGLLTENTEEFDDVTAWWYFGVLRAERSTDFYRTQYETMGQGDIIPLDTQLLLARLHTENVAHGDAMTEMQEALHDFIVDDFINLNYDDRVQKLINLGFGEEYAKLYSEDLVKRYTVENLSITPKFTNITFGEGVPGAGKTVGSSGTLIQVLATHPSTKPVLDKVAVISTTPAIAKGLGESLNLNNAISHDRVNFLKSILQSNSGNAWEAPKEENGVTKFELGVDYKLGKDGKLEHAYTIKQDADIPSLIIIDEVSRFSDFELQAIDEFARINGISVITYGDFDQTQTIGKVKLYIPNLSNELGNKYKSIIKGDYLTFDARLDRNNIMHGPKLGSTLRTANIQKTWNTAVMQRFVQEPNGVLTLRYYQGVVPGNPGTIIAGDKVYTTETQIRNKNGIQTYDKRKPYKQEVLDKILADIDIMIGSLTEGEQIGYIYSDKNSELYKSIFNPDDTLKEKYKGKIKPYFGTTAQSQEGQYFIIETDVKKMHNKQAFVQDLYTSITRSQVGSIVIVPEEQFESMRIVNNTISPDTVYTEEGITPESKRKYIERKKKTAKRLFDGMSLDEHHIEYVPRKKYSANPPLTNPVNPPTPPSTPPVSPTTGPTVNPNVLTFEEDKEIKTYSHSFNGEDQVFTFGDYTQIDTLPVLTKEWLESVSSDPEFKYLSEIVVSPTGKITLNLFDDKGNSKSFELPDGIDVKDLTNGVLELLPPPTPEPEEEEEVVEPEEEEPVTIATENPETLDEEAKEIKKTSVRKTVVEGNPKKLRDADREKEIRESFKFAQFLFSFNSFEDYGFEINDDGEIQPKEGLDAEIAKHRIDGINGLVRLVQKYDDCQFDDKDAELAYNILGEISSAAMHGMSLSEISDRVSRILFGESGKHKINCHFALKCSPRLTEGKEYFDTNGKFAQYERKSTEQSRYNDATDPVSQDAYRKQIVLTIELDGKPSLEVPVILLNSALSIFQMREKDDPVYPELLNVWDPENSTISIYEGVNKILNAFDNDKYPQYRTLMNLFRLFNFTMPGYFRLNKEFKTNGKKYDLRNWTIGKDLLNLGDLIELKRGKRSINGTNIYNREWVPITQIASDPRKTVSEVFVTGNDIYNDNGELIMRSGHPFVLVTSDKSLSEDDLWDIYKKDQNKPVHERDNSVTFYFVLPPKMSFGQYMISLRNFCFKGDKTAQPIGNNATIYRVFEALRQSLGDDFASVFRHGQFADSEKTYQWVTSTLDAIKEVYDDKDYSKAVEILKAEDENEALKLSNERRLINILKELVWPLGLTETGFKNTDNYGLFNLDVYNTLEEAFNSTDVVIYDSVNIKENSNGEIKPIKVFTKYNGYNKPTVYTGEETDDYKPGDDILEEDTDTNWHINGKTSTSQYQTKEEDESLGAFLDYVIRHCMFEYRDQIYQKHGKYGDGDFEYYEGAREDTDPVEEVVNTTNEEKQKMLDFITKEAGLSEDEASDLYTKLSNNPKEGTDELNQALINNNSHYIVINNEQINLEDNFPGLQLTRIPQSITTDVNGNSTAMLYLSDGSIYELIKESNKKPVYSKIQDKEESAINPTVNPEGPVTSSYIIGSDPTIANDELVAAQRLLLVAGDFNDINNLDSAIRERVKRKAKLGMLPSFLDSLRNYESRLAGHEYFIDVNHPERINNIKKMIDEIIRYASLPYNEETNEFVSTLEQQNIDQNKNGCEFRI